MIPSSKPSSTKPGVAPRLPRGLVLGALAFALLPGCIALKPTVEMVKLGEAVHDAEAVGAEKAAIYEHTMATEYRLKAHEEWGYSDYGASEDLARKGQAYAAQAEEVARYGETDENVEQRHQVLDELDRDAEDLSDTPDQAN